jgi:hypothetical protein
MAGYAQQMGGRHHFATVVADRRLNVRESEPSTVASTFGLVCNVVSVAALLLSVIGLGLENLLIPVAAFTVAMVSYAAGLVVLLIAGEHTVKPEG